MKTKEEILERIEHIKTLGKGYGINEKRIKELQWVLKPSKGSLVDNKKQEFKCKVCGKSFKNYEDYYDHYDGEHNKL